MENTKQAQHTPGPWKWVKARTQQHLTGPDGGLGISMSSKSNDANARLVAAAPELLEAAQGLADDLILLATGRCPASLVRDIIDRQVKHRAAINRATGR